MHKPGYFPAVIPFAFAPHAACVVNLGRFEERAQNEHGPETLLRLEEEHVGADL